MVSDCVPSGGRRAGSGRTVKVYLIRFIADLPLRLVTGCVLSAFNIKYCTSVMPSHSEPLS